MGDENKNKLFSLKEMESLFFKKELPEWWNVSINKISYRVLEEIFIFIEKNDLFPSSILLPLSNLLGTDATLFVKHAGNFRVKILNHIKKSADCLDLLVECLYPTLQEEGFIGQECSKIGDPTG
eukprot:TCONS_00023881-protein